MRRRPVRCLGWRWSGVRGDGGARPAAAHLRGAAHAGKNEARAARLERPHLGKESHLVDGLDHGVEHLALEWPEDHRVVPAARRRRVVRCWGPERRHRRAGAAAAVAAARFESRGALHVERDQTRACVSGGRRDTAAGEVMRLSGSNVSHAGRFARRPLGTGASSTPLRRRRCLSVAAGVGWGGPTKVSANRRASARKAGHPAVQTRQQCRHAAYPRGSSLCRALGPLSP